MKKTIYLVCAMLASSLARAQDQTIVIHSDTKIEASADDKPIGITELDTKKDIYIVADNPSLGNVTGLTLKTPDGKEVGPVHFRPTPKNITGRDTIGRIIGIDSEGVFYHLTITHEDKQVILIPNIGKFPGKRNGETEAERDAGRSQKADISCGCEKVSIETALALCPDCVTTPLYVYDARCKTLYRYIQDSNKYVEIYREGEIAVKKNAAKFEYKRPFRVAVIHVNRALENVEVSAENFVYQSQAPAIWSNVFGGTGEMINGLIKSEAGAQASGGEGTRSKLHEDIDELQKEIDVFATRIATLRDRRDILFDPCCESQQTCKDLDRSITTAKLREKLIFIQRTYKKLAGTSKEEIDALKKTRAEIAELDKKIQAAKPAEKEPLRKTMSSLKVEEANSAPAEAQATRLEALWASFIAPTEEELRDLVLFNRNFLKDNYVFVTGKIVPTGNRISLSIKINSQDSIFIFKNHSRPARHFEEVYDAAVFGKWFVSFSSGPFFGFGSTLYERKYNFDKIPSLGNVITDSSLSRLSSGGFSNPPIGLAGFMHVERNGCGVGYGGSLGVGLTAEDKPRLTYMLGPSLFLGDRHQLAVTAGILGMQVNVLDKDRYPDYLLYNQTPELSYSRRFKAGFFASISYTFFTLGK